MIVSALLVAWAGFIAWHDQRRRKVPNAALILVLVPAVLALCFERHGLLNASVWSSLGGMTLSFALTFPGYALRRFGAGDVKFATVLGLLLGTARGIEFMLGASLLMGAVALALSMTKLPKEMKFPAAPMLAAAFVVEMLIGPLMLA
ncbi:MAG TPA: prepilin peptidase [Solimonas sp.]